MILAALSRNSGLALAGLAFAASAQAATITVTPSLAPNIFGSPSYNDYVTNAIGALHDGQSSRGNPNSPAYYQAQSNVTASQSIVTGFPSWMGRADPGTVYGAAYANELGNRMLFGLKIDGNGQQFSISQVSFSATSSDPDDALGFSFGAGSYTYSTQYEGVLKGADGILFTADDIYITSGPATQLVDGVVGRGSGNSLAAYCDGCTTAQQQAAIDDAASYFTQTTTFTGTYSLGSDTGSGTFTISPDLPNAIPEPASLAILMTGLGMVGATARRRRKTQSGQSRSSTPAIQ